MESRPNVSDILLEEIEKTKQHIKETEINLRKYSNNIEGGNRNLFSQPLAQSQSGRVRNERGVGNLNFDRRRLLKRPLDEELYEEELPNKPSLLSLVGTAIGESKSREEVLKQQSDDKESKGRNRRMFGLLLGTLQQFKVEEKEKTNQLEKRKLVEQKVQVKEKEERHKLQKMRGDMITDKKFQNIKLKRLMSQIEIVQLHDEWEKQCTSLQYFIRTSSKPNIFYLPKSHNDQTQKKLMQSKKTLLVAIEKRRKQLEEDIKKLLENDGHESDHNQRDMDGNKDNKHDNHANNNNLGSHRRSDNTRDKKDNKRDHFKRDKEERKENEIKISDSSKKSGHANNDAHSDLDEDAPHHQVAIDYEGPIVMETEENENEEFQGERMKLPLEEIKLSEHQTTEINDPNTEATSLNIECKSGHFPNNGISKMKPNASTEQHYQSFKDENEEIKKGRWDNPNKE